jgi:hypothetical protein
MADFRDVADWDLSRAVQFPRCPCEITVVGPGQRRVQLTLPWHSPLHEQFRDWLDRVDAAAPDSRTLDLTATDEPQHMYTVYDGGYRPPSVRLNAFSGADFFDAEGRVTHDPEFARSCAAVCQLEGTWTRRGNDGRTRTGVRWKVLQVKAYADPLPPACLLADDDGPADDDAPPTAFAFLD